MKTLAIIAVVAASIAAPVAAQSNSTAFAIQHFNQDFDSAGDLRGVPSGDNTVTVSTSGSNALSAAFDVFNGSQDSRADLRGLNGATVVNGTPAHGAAIFAELRAAAAEDE